MAVFTQITSWLRSHLIVTVTSAIAVGSGGMWTTMTFLEQARVTRFEERMLSEYQKVAASEQSVKANLDKLSYGLAKGKKTDVKLVSDINSELLKMHTTLDSFKLGADSASIAKINSLQESLTELKGELLKADKLNDMEFVASRYVDWQNAYANAKPVIEERIGQSILKG